MRLKPVAVVAAAALGVSGCASDPAFWEGVAMGVTQAAAQLEAENRSCYWSPTAAGTMRQVCPGDYAYRAPVPFVCSAPDRDCDGYNDRPRHRDRYDRRSKDRHD